MWCAARRDGQTAAIGAVCARAAKLDETTRVEPIDANIQTYKALLELQTDVSKALRPAFAKHRRLAG